MIRATTIVIAVTFLVATFSGPSSQQLVLPGLSNLTITFYNGSFSEEYQPGTRYTLEPRISIEVNGDRKFMLLVMDDGFPINPTAVNYYQQKVFLQGLKLTDTISLQLFKYYNGYQKKSGETLSAKLWELPVKHLSYGDPKTLYFDTKNWVVASAILKTQLIG